MTRVLVTGSNGLLGYAFRSISSEYPSLDIVLVSRLNADLTRESEVKNIYDVFEPEVVIHAAAKVGGIHANMTQQSDFFYQNILMNTYMMHYAHVNKVKHFISFSSVCTFDANCSLLREDLQQQGEPHYSNFAYAYAKRMIDIQGRAYRESGSNTKFTCLIPANLYGPHDNFHLKDAHVIPALIHKCYLAVKNHDSFGIWGTGRARREFLYSSDLARITLRIVMEGRCYPRLLITGESEITIGEIAQIIAETVGYHDEIQTDPNQPEGQLARKSDATKFRSAFVGFRFTPYGDGIQQTANWFSKHYPEIRK